MNAIKKDESEHMYRYSMWLTINLCFTSSKPDTGYTNNYRRNKTRPDLQNINYMSYQESFTFSLCSLGRRLELKSRPALQEKLEATVPQVESCLGEGITTSQFNNNQQRRYESSLIHALHSIILASPAFHNDMTSHHSSPRSGRADTGLTVTQHV